MARPLKEGMDYFPHDTDASNDEKLEILTSLYGNDGYAFYFIILERIYRQKDFQIDISKIEIKKVLSKKIRVSLSRFEKILESSIIATLFNPELAKQGILTSDGIKKRANTLISKRLDMQERRNNKLVNSPQTQQEIQQETHQQTTPQTPQSKVKESKENKIKESSIEDKKKVADAPRDDFFRSDEKDDVREDLFYDLKLTGISTAQTEEILEKYPREFIGLKLRQINEQDNISNLPAYVVKVFKNADFECEQEMEKIENKRAEQRRIDEDKRRLNEMEMKKQEAQDDYLSFVKYMQPFVDNATDEDKSEFLESTVTGNNVYSALFKKEGFNNFVIDSKFREFLYQKYRQDFAKC